MSFYKLVTLSFATLVLCFFVVAPVSASGEAAVAKVGSVVITENDFELELQKLVPLNVSYHGGMKPEKLDKVKKEALQNLINRAYKFQYAIKEEISIDSVEFEESWNAYASKYNTKGVSEEELARVRASFYQELLGKRAEELAVNSKVSVSDEEVQIYYDENRKKLKKPRLYTASHIFVKVDPSALLKDKEQRKQKAEELYQKAIAGEDFYNLAYYNSDDRTRYVGGSLGEFHAGQTVREFDKVLATMKAGDISKPVKTIYGYHIIRLDALEEARQLTFDEVSHMMKKQTAEKRKKKLHSEWMAKLKKLFPLEVYETN